MLPPPTYNLRSHGQESATAGDTSLKQAIDTTEDTYTAETMTYENVQSPTESQPLTEQDEYSETDKDEALKGNHLTAEKETSLQYQSSNEKEDPMTSPDILSELNSPTVEKTTDYQKLTGKSQKIIKDEEHQEQEIISCPKCAQTFERRTQLTDHIKTHSTDQVTCPICNKKLTSSNSRDRHILTHSGEKPYKCELCQQKFSTNGNMNRHLKTHERKGTSYNGEKENSEEQEKILNKEGTSEELNESPDFRFRMNNKDGICIQNNYSKSLRMCTEPCNRQSTIKHDIAPKSDSQEIIKKLPQKRKRIIVSEEEGIAQILDPTEASDNLQKKSCQEQFNVHNTQTYNISTQSSSNCVSNNNQTDSQDLAQITDIILNVQQKPTTENEILKESSKSQVHKLCEQLYACDKCEYIGKDKNSLKRHSMIHRRNGTFKCGLCSLTFTNQANTQRHLKKRHSLHDLKLISQQIIFLKEKNSSSDEKCLACKYCPGTFGNEQALQHHLRSNECKMKPYFCTICDIGSSTKNNCFRHIENKHPELFKNSMTPEEKNSIKENQMRQTMYISPRQDENDRSEKMEAAMILCDLSENHQKKTINAANQSSDSSSSRMSNVGVLPISGETDSPVIVASNNTARVGTGHSVTDETNLPTVREFLSIGKKPNEFPEDRPLDLSVNKELTYGFAMDLSIKRTTPNIYNTNSPRSNVEGTFNSNNSQSAKNFGTIGNNLQLQKIPLTKQNTRTFRCKLREKLYPTNSSLQQHLVNVHKQPSSITQLEYLQSKDCRVHLGEFSLNSHIQHSDASQIKNSRNYLMNNRVNSSYDRGTGSDIENDLASIPSIQSIVNQRIHIPHTSTWPAHSVPLTHKKRNIFNTRSLECPIPARSPRKKICRIGTSSTSEFSPQNLVPVVTSSTDHLNDEESTGGSTTINSGNNTSAYDLSQSNRDQNSPLRITEPAEAKKDTDMICRYCSLQFSSKEHVKSHIKELHYLEHNNTLEVPDEKSRWKKERLSKFRQ